MLYYLGKGTEFKKEDCKEYKTIEGALKAAAKNEELVVWDENGGTGGNTPVEPENGQNGANSEQENGQQTSGDGDDAAGQETSGDDARKTEEQVSDSDTIYPEKTTRAIVDCDGALNLRRSASWGNESICGRAARGQSYYIKAIHTVEGKKMLETIDGIFLSGQPEHVRIIEV